LYETESRQRIIVAGAEKEELAIAATPRDHHAAEQKRQSVKSILNA